ncbi:MAG TPA: hypothetical protein PKD26_09860 [Pyrinomonadaceae bacterium]|nr:hypothetical protein [Pyrinomonadaceae bacterium]
MQPNLESIIEAARRLPPADRRKLVEALADPQSLSRTAAHRITDIRGVGKDLWTGIDAQKYVDSERDSWEN